MSVDERYYGDIRLYGSATTYSILLGRYFTPFLYFTEGEHLAARYLRDFGTTRITNTAGQAVALTDHGGHLSATIYSEGGIPLPFFRKLVDLYRDLRIEYKFTLTGRIISGSIAYGGETGPYYYTEDGDSIMV